MVSRQKVDRYKANSLRAYNQKWPERYDSSAFIRFWIGRYDQTVISAIDDLDRNSRILYVGCATDIVTVTSVFHHFFRPEMAIREISRVLSPGGKVVIVDPWFPPIIRHIINMALRVKPHDGDYRFYSPRGITVLFNHIGLETEWWRRAAMHSFVVVVRRPMSPTAPPDPKALADLWLR